MLVEIPKPGEKSIVFLDTSVLIDYLVGDPGLDGFAGLLEKNIRQLVNDFVCRQFTLRITVTIKNQLKHYRSIIRRLAIKSDVPPGLYFKIEGKVKKRFDSLQDRLLEMYPDSGQLPRVNAFYEKLKTKESLIQCRKKKEVPSELPEESDRMLIAEILNFPGCYLLAADCDFHTVDEELAKEFQIYVVSQENMNQVRIGWAWQ